MNPTAKSLAVVVCHHRVLGTFWALCALIPPVGVFSNAPWSGRFFLSLLPSAVYVGTSIGFIYGHTWARRVMGALLVIAALWFLDMMFMFGQGGSRFGVWIMFAALCLVAYTFLFVAISALYEPKPPKI